MYSRQRKARVFFGLSDILLISLAFEAAYRTRTLLHLERAFYMSAERKALVLGMSLAAWVAIALWLEVYDKLDSGHPTVILRDAMRQCGYGALAVVLMEYALRLDLSRPFLLLFSAYAWVLLLLFRLTAGRMVGVIRREFAAPHYVMVVGTGERALRMARELEQSAEYGVRLRGFLSETGGAPAEIALEALYRVWPVAELPSILRRNVVDEVIFAVGSERLAEMEEIFLMCDEEGVRTRVAVDFFPHVNSTVSLDRFGGTPLLTFSAAPHDEMRLLVKRIADIHRAPPGLVVLAPFMAAHRAGDPADFAGPVIFRQERCGLNGRRFLFYKFRSMCENAEEMKAAWST